MRSLNDLGCFRKVMKIPWVGRPHHWVCLGVFVLYICLPACLGEQNVQDIGIDTQGIIPTNQGAWRIVAENDIPNGLQSTRSNTQQNLLTVASYLSCGGIGTACNCVAGDQKSEYQVVVSIDLPCRKDPAPIVFLWHGSDNVAVYDSNSYDAYVNALTNAGFAVVQYDVVQSASLLKVTDAVEMQFPKQILDWMKVFSRSPVSNMHGRFDFSHIAVAGHSHGGSLAAYAYANDVLGPTFAAYLIDPVDCSCLWPCYASNCFLSGFDALSQKSKPIGMSAADIVGCCNPSSNPSSCYLAGNSCPANNYMNFLAASENSDSYASLWSAGNSQFGVVAAATPAHQLAADTFCGSNPSLSQNDLMGRVADQMVEWFKRKLLQEDPAWEKKLAPSGNCAVTPTVVADSTTGLMSLPLGIATTTASFWGAAGKAVSGANAAVYSLTRQPAVLIKDLFPKDAASLLPQSVGPARPAVLNYAAPLIAGPQRANVSLGLPEPLRVGPPRAVGTVSPNGTGPAAAGGPQATPSAPQPTAITPPLITAVSVQGMAVPVNPSTVASTGSSATPVLQTSPVTAQVFPGTQGAQAAASYAQTVPTAAVTSPNRATSSAPPVVPSSSTVSVTPAPVIPVLPTTVPAALLTAAVGGAGIPAVTQKPAVGTTWVAPAAEGPAAASFPQPAPPAAGSPPVVATPVVPALVNFAPPKPTSPGDVPMALIRASARPTVNTNVAAPGMPGAQVSFIDVTRPAHTTASAAVALPAASLGGSQTHGPPQMPAQVAPQASPSAVHSAGGATSSPSVPAIPMPTQAARPAPIAAVTLTPELPSGGSRVVQPGPTQAGGMPVSLSSPIPQTAGQTGVAAAAVMTRPSNTAPVQNLVADATGVPSLGASTVGAGGGRVAQPQGTLAGNGGSTQLFTVPQQIAYTGLPTNPAPTTTPAVQPTTLADATSHTAAIEGSSNAKPGVAVTAATNSIPTATSRPAQPVSTTGQGLAAASSGIVTSVARQVSSTAQTVTGGSQSSVRAGVPAVSGAGLVPGIPNGLGNVPNAVAAVTSVLNPAAAAQRVGGLPASMGSFMGWAQNAISGIANTARGGIAAAGLGGLPGVPAMPNLPSIQGVMSTIPTLPGLAGAATSPPAPRASTSSVDVSVTLPQGGGAAPAVPGVYQNVRSASGTRPETGAVALTTDGYTTAGQYSVTPGQAMSTRISSAYPNQASSSAGQSTSPHVSNIIPITTFARSESSRADISLAGSSIWAMAPMGAAQTQGPAAAVTAAHPAEAPTPSPLSSSGAVFAVPAPAIAPTQAALGPRGDSLSPAPAKITIAGAGPAFPQNLQSPREVESLWLPKNLWKSAAAEPPPAPLDPHTWKNLPPAAVENRKRAAAGLKAAAVRRQAALMGLPKPNSALKAPAPAPEAIQAAFPIPAPAPASRPDQEPLEPIGNPAPGPAHAWKLLHLTHGASAPTGPLAWSMAATQLDASLAVTLPAQASAIPQYTPATAATTTTFNVFPVDDVENLKRASGQPVMPAARLTTTAAVAGAAKATVAPTASGGMTASNMTPSQTAGAAPAVQVAQTGSATAAPTQPAAAKAGPVIVAGGTLPPKTADGAMALDPQDDPWLKPNADNAGVQTPPAPAAVNAATQGSGTAVQGNIIMNPAGTTLPTLTVMSTTPVAAGGDPLLASFSRSASEVLSGSGNNPVPVQPLITIPRSGSSPGGGAIPIPGQNTLPVSLPGGRQLPSLSSPGQRTAASASTAGTVKLAGTANATSTSTPRVVVTTSASGSGTGQTITAGVQHVQRAVEAEADVPAREGSLLRQSPSGGAASTPLQSYGGGGGQATISVQVTNPIGSATVAGQPQSSTGQASISSALPSLARAPGRMSPASGQATVSNDLSTLAGQAGASSRLTPASGQATIGNALSTLAGQAGATGRMNPVSRQTGGPGAAGAQIGQASMGGVPQLIPGIPTGVVGSGASADTGIGAGSLSGVSGHSAFKSGAGKGIEKKLPKGLLKGLSSLPALFDDPPSNPRDALEDGPLLSAQEASWLLSNDGV
eukprot:jgi/Botrbrau1/4244/Bobra.0044s0039.1